MNAAEAIVRRRRRSTGRKRRRLLAALAACFTLAAFILTDSALKRPLAELACERVRDAVSDAFTRAALTALEEEELFDVLTVTKTGENAFMVSADTAKLNRAAALIARESRELIAGMGEQGVGIELGTVSGVALLSGAGPTVRARFRPAGSVSYEPSSRLVSAGINQSLYTLYLTVTASVRVLLAGRDETVTVKNTVPIAETVIVGEAPQVYTNVADEEDMLNLIPTEAP